MKNNLLGKKGVIWLFSIIALVFGFWFLDSSFTGNAIINNPASVDVVSLIGLLLVACSAVLISYSVKR